MGTTISDVGTTRVLDTQTKSTSSSKANELGKDAFLELLVTQMENQNPLEPTSDTEFISQMANFSTLEQMQNMVNELQMQTTQNMIGKDVTANKISDSEGVLSNKEVYGRVYGVVTIGDNQYLNVYDYETKAEYLVPTSAVQQVTDGSADTLQTMLSQILSQLQTMSGAATSSEEAAEAYTASSTLFEA